jgi:hypothetical protein
MGDEVALVAAGVVRVVGVFSGRQDAGVEKDHPGRPALSAATTPPP